MARGASSNQPREGILDSEEHVEQVDLGETEAQVSISSFAKRRLVTGALVFVALLALPYFVPALAEYRPWVPGGSYVPFWNVVGRELLGQDRQLERNARELEELRRLASKTTGGHGEPARATADEPAAVEQPAQRAIYPEFLPWPEDRKPPKSPIVGAERLEHYFERLTLVELNTPRVIARAGQWGDSILGNDGVSGSIRRRLQQRFGDGGHGFHVLGRYNLAYIHQDVRFRDRGGWHSCQIIFNCKKDGHYGYGGVTTESSGGGTSWWSTTKQGIGSRVSRFELWYAKQPNGGQFQIEVDGEVERIVDTRAEQLSDGWESVEVLDGAHSFRVRAMGRGVSRGYGVVLERDGPGVVWDSLSLIGAFTQRLDYQDPEHIARQMRHRQTDLLVFMLGGNDVQREKMDLYRSLQPYEDEYARVIRKFRGGRPEASCLVMSVIDHGERVGYGIRTRKVVPKLVASQKQVAEAEGCAFFDTFEAMGGEGSIARWYRAKPALAGADLSHPTEKGHEVIAALFYQSLMHAYAQFRQSKVGKPLPELNPEP